MQRLLQTALLGVLATGLQAQLVVNTSLTPTQLVQDVLLGTGITVSNVSFNGVPDAGIPQDGTGSFTAEGTNLGIPAGIILTTGLAPAIADEQTGFQSDQLFPNNMDVDLETIAGIGINNATVLEFDFIPNGDSVKFRYVFGSEEYPEFVCQYNDAFGFFLSGPGISGQYSLGAENIALIPGTTTPVTIDNVNYGYLNNQNDPDCPAVNPDYYVDNTGGTSIVYDGFTVVIEAKRFVQCGQTYHIKLAIADAIDEIYDSGVFLEAGSFSSAPFIPSLTPGPGIVGNTIYESCFDMGLNFIRIGSALEADTFSVSYGGTFTNGEDIVPALPTEVIFPAGVTSIPFNFGAPIDADGQETIVITVQSISDCTGDTIRNVFTFFIDDAPPLVVQASPFSVDCGDAVEIGVQPSGGYGVYTYEWGGGETTPTINVAPLVDTSYPVTVTDTCGSFIETTVPVTVIPAPNPFTATLTPGPTVQGNTVQESCYEVLLNFNRTGGTAFADTAFVTLSGTATQGEDYTELPVEVIFPPGVSTVSFPVTFPIDADGFENLIIQLGDVSICNGGFSTVSFTFSIAQGPSVFALGGDATIPCGGSTVLTPIVTGGYLPYTFLWDQGQITEMITVSPTAPTTFRAVITDDCGNTTEASFDVDLAPPTALNMAIIGPSTVTEACETTSVNIIRPAGVQGDLVMDMSYSGTATNGIDFNWPTTQTVGMDLLNVVIPFEPLEDGEPDGPETAILTASYTDACGRTVSASVSITIVDAPPIVLQTMDQVVDCGPDSLAVTVDASGGFGSLDLSWNTGDQGPITYVPIQTGGTYIVTATDDCGRTASAQAVVDVDCVVIIPNVFSPNGDGRNDRFDIDGILGTKNTVRIYNRWGQVVYEANNYQNNWSAVGVPDGTYYYEVIIDRESKPYTGHVTILR